MRIDVIARGWGSPNGGPNGMAIAAAFLVETLADLGHKVRKLRAHDGFDADLIISTASSIWRRTAAAAVEAGATDRTVYWHHAGGVPPGAGCVLAAPPSVPMQPSGWSRHIVLPPSSWAAEAGGECTGSDIIVAGAGPAKGGHIALEVARLCPDLSWYVLQGRSAPADRLPWRSLPNAEVAVGIVEPSHFLGRARAVLSPTRFDVHPLLLVEAAVRGIPVVCTDMTATRCAAGPNAHYLPAKSPASEWAYALRKALERPMPKLRLRPYRQVVADALTEMTQGRAAA